MARDFAKFEGLIKKTVRDFSNLIDLDVCYSREDLIAEGNLWFAIMDQRHPTLTDEEFGKFFKTKLTTRFCTLMREKKYIKDGELQYKVSEMLSLDAATESDEDKRSAYSVTKQINAHFVDTQHVSLEKFQSLSEEAKEVVNIIMSAPAELLAMATGDVSISDIKRFLRSNRGWSRAKVKAFWSTLKLDTVEA